MATTPPASLSLGALLQRTLDVVRRHLAVLVASVAIVVTPFVLVGGGAAVLLGPGGERTYQLGSTLMAVVAALGGLIAVAGCIGVVLRERAGEPVSVGAALGFGLRRYPMVLAVTLIVALAVFAGMFACFLPGIYLLVRWAMAVPALLVEGGDVGAALTRGWAVVENRWWLTFGFLIAGYLLPVVVALVLQQATIALFGLAIETRSPGGLVGLGVAQVVGTCVTMPFTAVFLVLLYLELATTLPATAQERATWAPPTGPAVPYATPAPPPVPAPIPPRPPAPSGPLPGGFLPPAPADPPAAGGLAPPAARPPGAGD